MKRTLLLLPFLLACAHAQEKVEEAKAPSIPDLLKQVHAKYAGNNDGKVADYIPELTKANPKHFGIVIVMADGTVHAVGDVDVPFTIQSIAKPFVYALALEDHGAEEMVKKVGVEPTGLPFNSILPTEIQTLKTQNPLVNPGAIATQSLIKGKDSKDKFKRVHDKFELFAGQKLTIDEAVYKSEMATNWRNMSIAWLLKNYGLLYSDVPDAVDRYTRGGCIAVTANSLAQMGATLATGGKNPVTGKQVLGKGHVKDVLSVMTMAGMYDYSGQWFFRVGLPAKSGVGGGIVAVAPGKMSIATFSPALDKNGNSVRGVLAIQDISKALNLHVLRSR